MSLETMTKLLTVTTTEGQSSVTFSNIPQNYTDLKVVFSTRGNQSGDTTSNMWLTFNGSSALEYSAKILYGTGSATAATSESSQAKTTFLYLNGPSSTSSTFASGEVYIPRYSGNLRKAYSIDCVTENNATSAIATLTAGLWSNPSPITSLSLQPYSSTFAANSTFTLYGIKNMAQSMGTPGWSTGGALSFDGTYFYHAFTSSGLFVPNKPLSVDVLVVAGGGGGAAGGGGGGGLLEYENQSLLATPYSVAVGAGGSGGNGDTIVGTNGSNSSFGILTAAIGGGGGGALSTNLNGSTGGSGGGGGASDPSGGSGGSATSGQGNAGGSGSARNAGNGGGGGGGGAGAAGGNASSSTAGNGGAGKTSATITAMGNASGLGVLSSSSRYFAGGGGGGGNLSTQSTGGLGGGGIGYKQTGPVAGSAGTVNTGGGGGAGWNQSGLYSGGSGVVIIRYKG